jgi:hypothetical protein
MAAAIIDRDARASSAPATLIRPAGLINKL